MGACTVVVDETTVLGNKKVVFATITPSATYATNGDTWTLANFGMAAIDHAAIRSKKLAGSPNKVLVPDFDITNKKLGLYGGSTAAAGGLEEFGNGNDASGYSFKAILFGA